MADNRDKVRNGSALGGKYGAMSLNTLTDSLVDGEQSSDLQTEEIQRQHEAEVRQLHDEIERLNQELANRPNTPLENALIPVGENVRALGRFQFAARALVCPDDVLEGELQQIAEFLREAHGALQFWIGDLAIAYQSFGVTPNQVAAYFGVELSTLENWMTVCATFNPSRRRDSLDYSHHVEVAYLPSKLKGRELEILEYCEKSGLSVRALRDYIKSLLPSKTKRIPAALLFTKERAPKLGELRTIYMKARRGDKTAIVALQESVQKYHQWLEEIEKSLGIK